MDRIRFADTEVRLSAMCLGTMMFAGRCDEAEADRIVGRALEAGVDFFDTAAMYEDGATEQLLGRVLKGRRERIFLATKVHKGVDGAAIRSSIDESLTRLQTDHVDLYLIHWPRAGMRPAEMVAALHDVVQAGKARYVGCCNFPAWLLAEFNRIADVNGWSDARMRSHQIPYNLIERGVEVEVLPQAAHLGLCVTAYRPLVAGLLAGKYVPGRPIPADARGAADQRLPRWLERFGPGVQFLLDLAAQKRVTPAQLTIAWVRSAEGISCPIVGVSRLRQVEDSLGAFSLRLSADERAALTDAFGAEVVEESGGAYKGLRRETQLARL